MEINIERATSQDATAIVRLISELASTSNERTPLTVAYVASYLTEPGCQVLLAKNGTTIIGLLSYSIRPNLFHAGKVCLIEELVVNWGFRSRGIGSALIKQSLIEAEEAGCMEVSVSTDKKNSAAIRFYLAHEFENEAFLLEKHFEDLRK